ncbi:MAG: DUF4417 domain-containing protein [Thiohalocapsa sp.]|nr:DUF4417 domain-containing protein [Thiohalocapsa sp.]
MTRCSANWRGRPGNFDALHCGRLFPSTSAHGIPDLLPQDWALPDDFRLRPYRSRLDRLDPRRDVCHFYLDDYRFEPVWSRPEAGLRHVCGYSAACTPDFSLYPDWPPAAQVWNTYRSRWVGRWWQAHGVHVIPTVNWSDRASWAFCFDGIPAGQLLTISTADCRRSHVERRFLEGVGAMLHRCRPCALIVYGRLRRNARRLVESAGCRLIEVRPDWERLRTVS